jgi:hypothetical protein
MVIVKGALMVWEQLCKQDVILATSIYSVDFNDLLRVVRDRMMKKNSN